jgi:hypothetical protein
MVAPASRGVARWLLKQELRDGAADQYEVAAAVERICQKFFSRLAKVVSPAACQAFLSRALHIPRAEFPFLAGVRAGAAEPLFEGLHASLKGIESSHVRAALEVVLGTLIDLLASFIGQGLTLGMLRELWPGLPAFEPPADTTRIGGSTQ